MVALISKFKIVTGFKSPSKRETSNQKTLLRQLKSKADWEKMLVHLPVPVFDKRLRVVKEFFHISKYKQPEFYK